MPAFESRRWSGSRPERLANDQAVVVRVDLAAREHDLEALQRSLDDEERERLDRLRTETLRRRFLVTRARLRELLAGLCECSPRELVFRYGPHGKPALDGAAPAWHFNVAHSGELALLAVARRALGVDVEAQRERERLLSIASRYFAPRECAWIEAHAPERRRDAFYRLWTRKEAVLKAEGVGITVELAGIEVIPGEPIRGSSLPAGPDAIAWRLVDLPELENAASALALPPEITRIICAHLE